MNREPLTIVFFPEEGFGPTNNSVGIADILKSRGARVVFIVEESCAGTLAAKGFEEELILRIRPESGISEQPGQYWNDFMRQTVPEFRKTPLEQLETFIKPVWEELVDGVMYANENLTEILARISPDVIVEDNVVTFPAVITAGVPWVRSVSCNPLEIRDLALPPTFSGLPSDNSSDWEQFRRTYREIHRETYRSFNEYVQDCGCPPLPESEFIHASPYLNLYLYPEIIDYQRSIPLDSTWQRLDTCVRTTEPASEFEQLGSSGKLIYLSLGTLGSADTELMSRLIKLLGATQHRVIVSMGPRHEEITLADNMIGAQFLPQPSILPQVDLVITHGGNNTVAECFYFGKPMIVHPLFWDQHDNAQRIQELGFGKRLTSYQFSDEEFFEALDQLLDDQALQQRMELIATQLQTKPGTVKAANLIEQLVNNT